MYVWGSDGSLYLMKNHPMNIVIVGVDRVLDYLTRNIFVGSLVLPSFVCLCDLRRPACRRIGRSSAMPFSAAVMRRRPRATETRVSCGAGLLYLSCRRSNGSVVFCLWSAQPAPTRGPRFSVSLFPIRPCLLGVVSVQRQELPKPRVSIEALEVAARNARGLLVCLRSEQGWKNKP